MSQPRVTITFGRNGQRRAVVSRDMYSDTINRSGGAGPNKKRSVRERLGVTQDNNPRAVGRGAKRLRHEDGKWKHDRFEEKEETAMRQPSAQNLQPDLRQRLGRRVISRAGLGGVSTSGGGKDLREKLSGPIPAPQVQVKRDNPSQRRLASVVRGSSGIASLAAVKQEISRNNAPAVKSPTLQPPAVHRPAEVDENTVANLLQSLGLSKYLITFQAEEVDMAALQHMGDEDLKELGVPMGPRRKILLAVNDRA